MSRDFACPGPGGAGFPAAGACSNPLGKACSSAIIFIPCQSEPKPKEGLLQQGQGQGRRPPPRWGRRPPPPPRPPPRQGPPRRGRRGRPPQGRPAFFFSNCRIEPRSERLKPSRPRHPRHRPPTVLVLVLVLVGGVGVGVGLKSFVSFRFFGDFPMRPHSSPCGEVVSAADYAPDVALFPCQ